MTQQRKEHLDYQEGVRGMMQIENEHGLTKARQVAKYQGNLGLTVNQAAEIIEVLWPGAPAAEKKAAALMCHAYHLNPLAQHIFLIPYQTKQRDGSYVERWSRVMGIKAKRLIASRPRPGTTEYRPVSYEDFSPRAMTEAEQIKVFGKPDADHLCFVTILKDTKTGATAYGTGKWPVGKEPRGVDKGNTQGNMAGIRSESAALDRLRPGEMPHETVVMDETYIDGEAVDIQPEVQLDAPAPAIEQDLSLFDNEAPVPPRPAPPTKPPQQAPGSPPDSDKAVTGSQPPKPCETPLNLIGLKTLLMIHKVPTPDALTALGVKSLADIADFGVAWATLCQVRGIK